MSTAILPGSEVAQAPVRPEVRASGVKAQTVLSFDVEEHHRIEAATGLCIGEGLKVHYRERLGPSTHWLLDRLAEHNIRATFFVVGEIARHSPELVRVIHRGGHEVASHSWDHQRVHRLTPAQFRADVRRSKDALEQVTGEEVVGYRAPTFSVVRQTAWAIDVLAEEGMRYDSSIYPVRHDRYGVPDAPRTPFLARGLQHTLLELPPATLRLLGANLPDGGGGYFRLFPLFLLKAALWQLHRNCDPPVAVLYFHPWEFDPQQQRLPLGRISRFRTYVGIARSGARLQALLEGRLFTRAIDLVGQLSPRRSALPEFEVGGRSAA